MRNSCLVMLVALTALAMPATAQQQPAGNSKMQSDANKGVKTRNSGASGYVAGEGKADPAARGQTTGSTGGTGRTDGPEPARSR